VLVTVLSLFDPLEEVGGSGFGPKTLGATQLSGPGFKPRAQTGYAIAISTIATKIEGEKDTFVARRHHHAQAEPLI
jgi:hypothetical protein